MSLKRTYINLSLNSSKKFRPSLKLHLFFRLFISPSKNRKDKLLYLQTISVCMFEYNSGNP